MLDYFFGYDNLGYMIKIEEALQSLGLNEKQAIVYINLLQLGKATAYKIAQKSNLKRPTVYVVLDELRIKGLVLKIPYPKKQIYSAKSPGDLIADSEAKLRKVKNVLPELLALVRGEQKPSVMYFEGENGIKNVLDFGLDRLENTEIVGFNAHTEGTNDEIATIFGEYNNKVKKMGIKTRGIVPDHPSLKMYREKDADFGRNMKIVPFEKYSSDVSIDMGPDFVRILMFKDLQGVVIEHKGLALALKQIFEMQWATL